MGITRTDLFTREQNELATVARVLGHPARIAILQHLAQINGCINSDLVKELGLAQATVSQHLRELKEIGLIRGTIDGVSMNYCIDAGKWKEVKALLTRLFDEYDPDRSCC